MKLSFHRVVAAILTASIFATAPAGAMSLPKMTVSAAQSSSVSDVAWRNGHRGGGYGYRHHRGIGGGAIIGGIVAGALIAGAIRESRASGSDVDRCEASYRSFDRSSGTYVGYDGERHVCPDLE